MLTTVVVFSRLVLAEENLGEFHHSACGNVGHGADAGQRGRQGPNGEGT